MNDISVVASEGAASLARIGSVLGAAGIGLEGGGMWSGVAHYLVADGEAAARALDAAGISGVELKDVVVVSLDADVPGALARMMDRLAAAGVGLTAQYSDHDNRKVLIVDDPDAARTALT